jgi:Carboxypeptidase regulatory-like domain
MTVVRALLSASRRHHARAKLPCRSSRHAALDFSCRRGGDGRPRQRQPGFRETFSATSELFADTDPSCEKSLSMVFVNPSGAGVPHTKVTLRQASNQNEFTAETNDAGEAFFSDLPKGIYELTAIYPGFRPFHLSQVNVPYGPKMQLSLGSV